MTTEQSISALILAAIIPGILTAFGYMSYVGFRASRDKKKDLITEDPDLVSALASVTGETLPTAAPAGAPKESWPRMIRAGLWIFVIFVIIIAGTFSGQFTIIESAGVGAFVALFALIFETGREGWRPLGRRLRTSLYEAATTTSSTFMILVGASIFAFFLLLIRVPSRFADWVGSLEAPPLLIVVLTLATLIPLGMFLDSLSVTIIVAPILHPIITSAGFDGILYAILFVKLIEIGLVTPPVGMNVYVVGTVSKVPVEQIFKGVLPFIAVEFVLIAILIAVPQLTLWLPGLVG